MVRITWSSDTLCVPVSRAAMREAMIAVTAPKALRSMQGICTRPPTGSQVRAEVVLHGDFGGMLHLFVSAFERRHQSRRGHGGGDADLALAPHLRARDGGILAIQRADGGGRQQEAQHALFVAGLEALVVVEHGRDHAGRAVRRRRHDASARRISPRSRRWRTR